jgi:hypothetical protein
MQATIVPAERWIGVPVRDLCWRDFPAWEVSAFTAVDHRPGCGLHTFIHSRSHKGRPTTCALGGSAHAGPSKTAIVWMWPKDTQRGEPATSGRVKAEAQRRASLSFLGFGRTVSASRRSHAARGGRYGRYENSFRPSVCPRSVRRLPSPCMPSADVWYLRRLYAIGLPNMPWADRKAVRRSCNDHTMTRVG